jgi:hypothetical protein
MRMDEGDAEQRAEMPSGHDTADMRYTTPDSVRDTIPAPAALWLPARQSPGGWRRGQR